MKGAGRSPTIVGISGPDGAGKTRLCAGLARNLRPETTVVGIYLYGCVVCRRFGTAWSGGRPPESARGRETRGRLQALHALVDAAELAFRLAVGSVRARRHGAVLLTERSPLDGLVKHDPRPGSLVYGVFERLIGRYDLILALDAEEDFLVERDSDHSREVLASMRRGFATWSKRFPAVVEQLCASGSADEVARSAGLLLVERGLVAKRRRSADPS
jgi:hypothetical protein